MRQKTGTDGSMIRYALRTMSSHTPSKEIQSALSKLERLAAAWRRIWTWRSMHGTRQDVKTRLCLEIVAGDDSARTVSCPTTPGWQASLAYAQHIKPRWTAPSKLGHCVTSCAPYSGNGLSEKDVTRPLACRSLTSMAASIMSVCLRNPARVEIP